MVIMQMIISGHHVEVTQALKEYVHNKLAKVERHFDHITSMQVILSIEKLAQKAEATIRISGAELFANTESGRVESMSEPTKALSNILK